MWLILTLIFIEFYYRPRLDFTHDQKLLLWYGRTKRNYIIILEKK